MRKVTSLAKIAVAPLLIAFIVCVQIPAQIYWHNSEEFVLTLSALAPMLWASFAILCAILLLPAMVPNKSLRLRYVCFAQALALLAWFTASFRFGEYGAFDGGAIDLEPLSAGALLELGVWCVVLCLAVVFGRRLAHVLWQAVAFILFVSAVTLVWQALQQHFVGAERERPKVDSAAVFHEQLFTFSSSKNVVHIVLDELQTTVTSALLKHDPELGDVLDGFVFYPNTAANYASTYMAIPAMLTGKIYRNEYDKEKFMDAAMHGDSLPNVLQQAGFRVDHHTIPTQCEGTRLPHCSPIRTGLPSAVALSLIDFGFFRAAPEFFKAAIHNQNDWFVINLFFGGSYHATLGGRAHVLFGQFNRKLRVENAAPPTYKYFHSMLTHRPLTLTSECGGRSEPAKMTLPNRRAQAQCAFMHVKHFLEKLKALGIYDETMVVISADHGSSFQIDSEIDTLIKAGIPPIHHARALATLLVKPFGARGVLRASPVPAQLSDIPNTVLADLDMELLDHGEDIAALPQDAQRVREFMYFRWDFNIRTLPQLQEKLSYWIRGDVRNAESWQHASFADYIALNPRQTLQCGETVNFSNPNLADKIASAGLDKAESWGRWTTGGKVMLYFRYDAENCQPNQLAIQTGAFVNDKNPKVTAALHLNGEPLGQLTLSDQEDSDAQGKRVSWPLPRRLLKEGDPNVLELDISGTNSPHYLGMAEHDDRLLGLALISLTIDKADVGGLTQR
ncbi:MAG: sulfatase-like hydrolase/transferase [Pseudomonadales bacterium]